MEIFYYYVINSERNKLWYRQLVGKYLSEDEFEKTLFNCFLEVRKERGVIKLPYKD